MTHRLFKGKKIEETQDKLGNKVLVRHSETLERSECYLFFLKNYVELLESDRSVHQTPWNDKDCGFLYLVDGENYTEKETILGCLLYDRRMLDAKCLWCIFMGVDKNYRDRGLYKILHKHSSQLAKDLGCNRIAAYHNVDNAEMLTAMKATGGMQESNTLLSIKWLI